MLSDSETPVVKELLNQNKFRSLTPDFGDNRSPGKALGHPVSSSLFHIFYFPTANVPIFSSPVISAFTW